MADDYETYSLGDFDLKIGEKIPNAHIAYKTFGDREKPLIIYPSWYSGAIADNEWLIGEDKTLSPKDYFIVITALFGNGQSSSPSNTPGLKPFPQILFYDNVRAQHELVSKKLGFEHARAVLGWSMGAGQTYQWGTQYPDFVDILVPICGSAKTSLHNQVFLEGVKSALLAGKQASSAGICKGEAGHAQYRTWSEEERTVGLKALGRVYAGWGFSQAFYREKLYEKALGFNDLNDFMVNFWEAWALTKGTHRNAYYAYTMVADSARSREHAHHALHLASRGLLGPGSVRWRFQCGHERHQGENFRVAWQDRSIFPYNSQCLSARPDMRTDSIVAPEDSKIEVENMSKGIGELHVIPSIWGHWAGG